MKKSRKPLAFDYARVWGLVPARVRKFQPVEDHPILPGWTKKVNREWRREQAERIIEDRRNWWWMSKLIREYGVEEADRIARQVREHAKRSCGVCARKSDSAKKAARAEGRRLLKRGIEPSERTKKR